MCTLEGCFSEEDIGPAPRATDEQRRLFLKGLVALPLAMILADPVLAQAAASHMKKVKIKTPEGYEMVADLALPATLPAPCLIIIHEWWGLNDQIRSVAKEYANKGFITLAVDLFGKPAATKPEEAKAQVAALDPAVARSKLMASVEFLRNHSGSIGKVGVLGWCFGGGWALNTALISDVDAVVVYYGNVAKTSREVAPLNAPLMGHFGTKDKNINKEMVDGFEQALSEAGKLNYQVFWYDADHAFANPTGARYDSEDAELAWERTLGFLETHLAS